jgi:hypothetical protein
MMAQLAGQDPVGLLAADVTGDGIIDIVTANHGESAVTVFGGNGDGTLQAGVKIVVGLNPYSVAASDLDGDGRQDLVVANTMDQTAAVLLGNCVR